MSIAGQLAEFALAQPSKTQFDAAEQIMRLSLFDWAVCGIAGIDEPVARIMRSTAQDQAAAGNAAVFGLTQTVSPAYAALANGATSHALDYDDTHFAHIGHPSVAVFPAAMAIGSDGADVMRAALIGAEVSVRVGLWLGRSHYQAGFHQTATAGAFGATAAAGRLLGLSQDALQSAFGVAATQSAGLKSQFGTMGKPYHAGLAARTGIEAAQLAQAGFDTRGAGVDGPQGFGPTHSGEANKDAFDDLGEVWHMETVSHKFHACCHGLHAMLEAIAAIDAAPEQIDRIEVTTHPRWLSVCNISDPASGLESKFSYRHTAAMAVLGYETSALKSYTDTNAAQRDLVAMRQRVDVLASDTLKETEAHVSVKTTNGLLFAHHDLSIAQSYSVRAQRLRQKAKALLGQELETKLWRATHEKRAPDLDALSQLIRNPTP